MTSSPAPETMWLAARRDHDGNYDLLRMPDGESPAWDLTEAQADAALAHVEGMQRKVHGQSYWKFAYPAGGRTEFLRERGIRV